MPQNMLVTEAAKEDGAFDMPEVGQGYCSGARVVCNHRLVGLVVKASTSRAKDPRFESRLRRDFFGRLVGPVSVYCDCVR